MSLALLLLALLPAVDDSDGFRSALVPLGDVDGDGVPDLAFAHRPRPFCMGSEPTSGWPRVPHLSCVFLVSGKDGTGLHAFRGPAGFGKTLCAVGDLDGDGCPELAIGSGGTGPGQVVTIVSTGSRDELARIEAPPGVRAFGCDLDGGAQLVGSPAPDLLIGSSGAAYLVDGATLEPVWRLAPTAEGHVERSPVRADLPPEGEERSPEPAGRNVSAVCDLDGDGLGEIAISSPPWGPPIRRTGAPDPRCERSLVVFSGGEREPLQIPSSAWCLDSGEDLDGDGVPDLVATSVNVHTRALSGATGERIWGRSYVGGYLHSEGTSLAFTSDHDGDGVRDVVVGANEGGVDADLGWARVLSGRSGRPVQAHSVRIDTEPGPPGGCAGGVDVAPLGDLDGDGLEELVVWEPVPQCLRLLGGQDLGVRWDVDVSALSALGRER